MYPMVQFRATMYFRTDGEGGVRRSQPVVSGYRPALDFGLHDKEGHQLFHTCVIELADRVQVPLGVACPAHVRILDDDELRGALLTGKQFEAYEGPNLVGRGRIIETLPVGESDAKP